MEIDSGETFCYDTAGNATKAERELQAADRIFGLLPADQREELRSLWDEFEAQSTADARFAASLDRLQPMLHNVHTQGGTWKQHQIHAGQVYQRMAPIQTGLPALWPMVEQLVADSVAKGYLKPAPTAVEPT